MHSQRRPLPVLPLPAPHADLCLAPSLPSDAADQTRLLNDPRIAFSLRGPPFPFPRSDAEAWIAGEADRWAEGSFWEGPSVIRRVAQLELDAPPSFLGTITLSASPFEHVADGSLRARLAAENLGRPEEEKRWSLGFYLDPQLAGRGVMTAACRALIAYAESRGLSKSNILGAAFAENKASIAIQRRLGLAPRYIARGAVVFPASKGGRKVDVVCLFPPDIVLDEEQEEEGKLAERFVQGT